MDLSAPPHRYLTPQQAMQEFALVSHFEPGLLVAHLKLTRRILVIERELQLTSAQTQNLLQTQQFVIVVGDFLSETGINLSQASNRLSALLVIGNMRANYLNPGQGLLSITGNLELQRYLHSPRQVQPGLNLQVAKRLLTPVYLQENVDTNLVAGEFICPYRYHADDGLSNWPSIYFSDAQRQTVGDCEGLVSHILQEVRKPPELQANFDWVAHYDFNPKRYPKEQSLLLSNAAPCHPAELSEQFWPQPSPLQLQRLHTLELSELYTEYLPDWLMQCFNLQQLKLDNCFSYLHELPDLSALRQLRCLEINGSNPDLQRHPVCAQRFVRALMQMELPALEYLSINFWNATPGHYAHGQENSRPALNAQDLIGIGKFRQLKVINFYGNGLSDLPLDFYELQQLRYIRIVDQLTPSCRIKLTAQFSSPTQLLIA